jgi:hypothetical protein
MKRCSATLLAATLALCEPTRALAQPPADASLERGIREAQGGDFQSAIVTLDEVVRRLKTEPGRAKDLARAYTYLSIAYLGLSQEQTAKAKFVEAWKTDNQLEISPREFPPRILKFFEDAKKEAGISLVTPSPTPAPSPAAAAPAPASTDSKGGGARLALILGGLAAVGGGIALAAGGGGGDSPPATSPPATSPALNLTGRWTGGSADGFRLRAGTCFEDDDVILDLMHGGTTLSGNLRSAARAANCAQVGKVEDFSVTGSVSAPNVTMRIQSTMGYMNLTGTLTDGDRRMTGTLQGGALGGPITFEGTWAVTR